MILVEPSNVSFDPFENETIMTAALRNGYSWPTICEGRGTCKTCVFQIMDGESNLEDMGSWEAEALASITDSLPGARASWRLACQAKATGNVRIRKIGVKKT